ncbi:hypothetical protein HAX54_019621 [Datura stramonium]|uniref:Uncharacterized protein n=1 Tax=Datura stramonium TaxID=4076 RepID=A0ABS8USC8_DATST|nr:hypothetical protein [Datura stramonium]
MDDSNIEKQRVVKTNAMWNKRKKRTKVVYGTGCDDGTDGPSTEFTDRRGCDGPSLPPLLRRKPTLSDMDRAYERWAWACDFTITATGLQGAMLNAMISVLVL